MFYHALISKGDTPAEDLSPVLLWENPNVTESFAAQTISLDLTEYAGVIIDFNQGHTSGTMRLGNRSYLKKTDNFSTRIGAGWVTDSGTAYARNIIRVDDAGVQFSQGSNIEYNIPIAIYGVKNYIVEPAVGDLLWHNDNPTVALEAKEIAGDYSKYSKICVEYRLSTTVDYKLTLITEKHNTYQSGIMVTEASGSVYRRITFKDSTINITQCTKIDSSMATSTVNTSCIITDIYGIE